MKLVFPAPRSLGSYLALAMIFAFVSVYAVGFAVPIGLQVASLAGRVAIFVAAAAVEAAILAAVLRELRSNRRVEIDPVGRVLRVRLPASIGTKASTWTSRFESIRRVVPDTLGCVRLETDDRWIDVVDVLHPCTPEGAKRVAARIHELVFGTPMPEPAPEAPARALRVAPAPMREEAAAEMDDDAGREQAQAPRRRGSWDE